MTVCTLSFCWEGGCVEPPTKFKKGGDLTGPQFLEGDDLFQGGGVAVLHKK